MTAKPLHSSYAYYFKDKVFRFWKKSYFLQLILLCWSDAFAQNQDVDIKTFVTTNYIHGIPYEKALTYKETALPTLIEMLNDTSYENFRPNIVLVMGMIGSPKAIQPLKTYFEKHKGELSASTFTSILTVFQAVGYILQTGDKAALKFLEDWSNPEYWQRTSLRFTYGIYKKKVLGYIISKMAVQGLGISGRPEALSILQDLQNPASSKHKLSPKKDVAEAIQLNARVKNEGARTVFGKEEKK